MSGKPFITLEKLVEDMKLEVLYKPESPVTIENANINRPGLALCGFFTHFDSTRIQIIGRSEHNYIEIMSDHVRERRLDEYLRKHPRVIVYSTSLEPCEAMLTAAKKYEIPILRADMETSAFMASLIAKLNYDLAPCITRHGVLVEVYGEGVLLLGESGIGKSETAIELVKRGHRLIADDAVELRRVSNITVIGQAPDLIRYYVELRGIGIVDVKRVFGTGAVKDTEKVDLVINLEQWIQGKMYDRMGLDSEYTNIMGIDIPSYTIPVHPGRNLAVIIEIAAINNRQKRMGYNTAKEFNDRALKSIGMSEHDIGTDFYPTN